jgi:hypothetical protein
VKGAQRLGVCVGNRLSAEQGKTLIAAPLGLQPHKVRDKAVLSMPIGCGLRRAELVKVRIEDFNFGRIDGSWWTSSPKAVTYERYRYRPWVKFTVDAWVNAANSQNGTLFHAIGKTGKVWGTGFTPKVIWSLSVKQPPLAAPERSLRTICVERALGFAIRPEVSWNKFSSFWVTFPSRRLNDISGVNSGFAMASTTELVWNPIHPDRRSSSLADFRGSIPAAWKRSARVFP